MTLIEKYNFPEGTTASMLTLPVEDYIKYSKQILTYFHYKNILSLPEIDLTNITNITGMFANSIVSGYEYNIYNISKLDTSNITNMSEVFKYSSPYFIKHIGEWDTSNVTNMSNMFNGCNLSIYSEDYDDTLKYLENWNTSNVTNMSNMFNGCSNIAVNAHWLGKWDTSNVTNMSGMFNNCTNIKTLPPLNCSSLTSKNFYPFSNYSSQYSKLTEVGGFIGMKMTWDNSYGLCICPNLTYESCINILNGLHDFVGNGETPNSAQGKLKVHANFLTAVGDEISIGTAKGWTITA